MKAVKRNVTFQESVGLLCSDCLTSGENDIMCAASVANTLGVEVSLVQNSPCCPHGPTLLFERFNGKHKKQRYYACSACRDRKDCSFYQLADEKVSEAKKMSREELNRSQQPWTSHEHFFQRMQDTKDLSPSERKFCQSCSLLLRPQEVQTHSKHKIKADLTDAILSQPSYLLLPLEDNKTNAQYLFSKTATEFLITTIKRLGYDRVLCVGSPRLHEMIQSEASSDLSSLLLDIDHRYGQFYPPSLFCRYNMFNDHFLDGEKSRTICEDFLHRNHGDGIVMVTDPPFGGRVEILAEVIQRMMGRWTMGLQDLGSTAKLPLLWIFPYFLEQRILDSFPSFTMLDYKVDYDNHPLFQSNRKKARKKGSPVRVFTNLQPSEIHLPLDEGYRFCKACKRYVAEENIHCTQCNSCTSKDGSTYKHCKDCQRCVKPGYVHCTVCQRCELPDHQCNRQSMGCHICGSLTHKRKECTDQSSTAKRPKKKRKR
ncbi:rRNA N6-adenosine-methyltransferase ZCCHC4-like isoform X1 [Asterias rubens]|uniref:rRNA N6-adenosine-methyltransferase ZCCHC4-like isoform X1 n=1 Tax=Asterias rubens TaxID=7604 RepID=UPI0014552889|nr:rRNA N6-adenosine-methyltransferase ZCCHC4-like isoform X1 [Asterias rubens]